MIQASGARKQLVLENVQMNNPLNQHKITTNWVLENNHVIYLHFCIEQWNRLHVR
jgi:hypothetical protein